MKHPRKAGAVSNDPGYRLKSFFIDKSFANTLSSNLKSIDNLNSIILSRNTLSDEALIKIIDNLP